MVSFPALRILFFSMARQFGSAASDSDTDIASNLHLSDLSDDSDSDFEDSGSDNEPIAHLTAATKKYGLTKKQKARVDELRSELRATRRLPKRARVPARNAPVPRGRTPEAKERWFSVTCSVKGEDLREADFNHFATWITDKADWGAVAYERGSRIRHWHAQGVAKVTTTSYLMACNDCKRWLGWYPHRSPYGNKLYLLFRELKNRDLHTPEGMLGYTLKDCDEYDGWMALLHDDVTDCEVERGRELYAMFGAPEKCNTCSLLDEGQFA
jgi:hypothetical protein